MERFKWGHGGSWAFFKVQLEAMGGSNQSAMNLEKPLWLLCGEWIVGRQSVSREPFAVKIRETWWRCGLAVKTPTHSPMGSPPISSIP